MQTFDPTRIDIPPQFALLVVDDEPDILESLQALLHHEFPSLRIVVESDPVRAIDHLRDPSLRVVLADYLMPRMDGIDFLREARWFAPNAARVLLTAYPTHALAREEALATAADAVWMKPMETGPFLDRIARLLHKKADGDAYQEA